MNEAPLFVVFMTGLLGGVHCAGMCGGIVSALAMKTSRAGQLVSFAQSGTGGVVSNSVASSVASPVASSVTNSMASSMASPVANPVARAVTVGSTLILYNAGRLGMYTLLGAMAGAIGSVAWIVETTLPLQQFAFALTNALLILMGLYLWGIRAVAQWSERIGQKFWKIVQPHARRQLGSSGGLNTVVTGALWGLVPCGMVYGVLMMSLVSGSSHQGALLMLAFGAGTLPNLLALGAFGQYLARAGRHRSLRRVVGAVIVAFGVLGLLRLEATSHLPFIGKLCAQLP